MNAPVTANDVKANLWSAKLLIDKSGAPKSCIANALTCLELAPALAGRWRYNEFLNKVEVRGEPWDVKSKTDTWEHFTENSATLLAGFIHKRWALSLPKVLILDAAAALASKARFHPIRVTLEALPVWDGEDRASRLWVDYWGAEDTPAHRATARSFLLGAVARVFDPGCQRDELPVLVGPQGTFKSTGIRELVGLGYVETSCRADDKDALQLLHFGGAWVVEFGELASLGRVESESFKSFCTRTADHFRPSYARDVLSLKRSCVFIGTSNGDSFLRDVTGNRRFWVIPVKRGDRDRIRKDREQLWAQAVAMFRAGESWRLDDTSSATMEETAQTFLAIEPWRDVVARRIEEEMTRRVQSDERGKPTSDFVTLEDIAAFLDLAAKDVSQSDAQRVGRVMRELGAERKKFRLAGRQVWGYALPSSLGKPGARERAAAEKTTKPQASVTAIKAV